MISMFSSANIRNFIQTTKFSGNKLQFLVLTQLLYIDSVLHLESLQNRWLVKLLTCAEFFHNTCLLELSLKLFESSFNVLAIFYGYNNHAFGSNFYVKLMLFYV